MKRSYLFVPVFLLLGTEFLFLLTVHQSYGIQAEDSKIEKNVSVTESSDIPDHEVQYEGDFIPDWKVNWDLARQLYREKKYREALVQYELLLNQKENIDEARWEYATLLMREERWQQAAEQIEQLITNDPGNMDYCFAMAETDINIGRIDAAIDMYKDIYARTVEAAGNTIRALEGLTKSLRMKGELEEVLFYQERLIALKPNASQLQIEFAKVALQTGQVEKARTILDKLEQDMPENPSILTLQAKVQHQLGNKDTEAEYFQRLVALNPLDLDAHAMLYKYYMEREDWTKSLKHLEVLLKENPDDVDILEAAAELNMRQERLDKALEYYNTILALQPNNKKIIQKKQEAQKKLAEELVVLVEHDGSQKLWQDLVNVTSDRTEVYRQIAGLLKEKGKNEELIEVLTLICQEDPSDDQTLADLTSLLKEAGRDDELKILMNMQKQNIQ